MTRILWQWWARGGGFSTPKYDHFSRKKTTFLRNVPVFQPNISIFFGRYFHPRYGQLFPENLLIFLKAVSIFRKDPSFYLSTSFLFSLILNPSFFYHVFFHFRASLSRFSNFPTVCGLLASTRPTVTRSWQIYYINQMVL